MRQVRSVLSIQDDCRLQNSSVLWKRSPHPHILLEAYGYRVRLSTAVSLGLACANGNPVVAHGLGTLVLGSELENGACTWALESRVYMHSQALG